MRYRFAIALALALAGVAWSVARAFQPLRAGDPAADFELAAFKLRDYCPGNVVLVNFFTTW